MFQESWDYINITDVAQAAYLVQNGIMPVQIIPVGNKQCQFVFRNTPQLKQAVSSWRYSTQRSFYIHYRELLTEAFRLQEAFEKEGNDNDR
jgi:hypothetical protein